MKVFVLIGFLLLANIKYDNPKFDPYFFSNNFNDEIHEGDLSFYAFFNIGDRYGDSSNIPCTNLDTNLYKNKKLGFIINDLSNKYKFMAGMIINGDVLFNLNESDLSFRTHFLFNFKYNDTLSLSIAGIIAKSERFSEESDSIAFNKLLEIHNYILLPVHSNINVVYRHIIERMKNDKNPKLKEDLDELLKDYPAVAK